MLSYFWKVGRPICPPPQYLCTSVTDYRLKMNYCYPKARILCWDMRPGWCPFILGQKHANSDETITQSIPKALALHAHVACGILKCFCYMYYVNITKTLSLGHFHFCISAQALKCFMYTDLAVTTILYHDLHQMKLSLTVGWVSNNFLPKLSQNLYQSTFVNSSETFHNVNYHGLDNGDVLTKGWSDD